MRYVPGCRTSVAERRRSRDLVLLVTSLMILGFAILVLFPVAEFRFYAPCLWRSLTGTYCPGCGSLRGISAMVHGDPLGLLRNNLFAFISLPFLAYAYISLASRAVLSYRPPSFLASRCVILTLAGLIIVFGLLRNLVPVLAPRPL